MVIPINRKDDLPFDAIVKTYFSFLDEKQRSEFRLKWHEVARLATKWHEFTPGAAIKVFAGQKDLEREIEDLENLSLAAYRAMKLLRQQLEANQLDEEQSYSG